MTRVTAVFDNHSEAEQAINELRNFGFSNDHLSLVARHAEDVNGNNGQDVGETAKDTAVGALAGAGVGAALGLAAAFIPGIGPFIAAGTIAHGAGWGAATTTIASTGLIAASGGAAAGAITGTVVGGVAGALAKVGYEDDEAEYYGREVEGGNILVAVEADDSMAENQARAVLNTHGGRSYQRGASI